MSREVGARKRGKSGGEEWEGWRQQRLRKEGGRREEGTDKDGV